MWEQYGAMKDFWVSGSLYVRVGVTPSCKH